MLWLTNQSTDTKILNYYSAYNTHYILHNITRFFVGKTRWCGFFLYRKKILIVSKLIVKKPLEIKNTIYKILPNKKTKIPMFVNMLLTPIIALPTSIFLVFFFTLFSTEIRYVHKKRLRHWSTHFIVAISVFVYGFFIKKIHRRSDEGIVYLLISYFSILNSQF